MTLTFNPGELYDQGQSTIGSKDSVETRTVGRTDTTDRITRITFSANAFGNSVIA